MKRPLPSAETVPTFRRKPVRCRRRPRLVDGRQRSPRIPTEDVGDVPLGVAGRPRDIQMNIEKYTERARGFIQSAQSLAMREGHQQFSALHILKVLLDDPEGLAGGLIDRSGGNSRSILKSNRSGAEQAAQRFPVPAPARSIWRPIPRAPSTAAEQAAEKAGDELRHRRAAAAGAGARQGQRGRPSCSPRRGVTPQDLNSAINALRKGRTADIAVRREGL
ncbi:MAG: hypothetical protein MZV49_22300 [Rhodopseudomonas palustris]|nr:hypothetical protein [Rhodopseudomonas palustris]